MKKLTKLTSIIFILLCLTTAAHAKVTLNNSTMTDGHLSVVKGLLYDLMHTPEAKKDKETPNMLPNFARAVVWITDCHFSKKVYKLEKIHTEDAKLIKRAVKLITEFEKGKYPGLPYDYVMQRWYGLGQRVIAQYVKVKEKIVWKFELLPEKSQTKNLVFKHHAEVVQINKK
jgi:uncharacterized protein with HEPN domain